MARDDEDSRAGDRRATTRSTSCTSRSSTARPRAAGAAVPGRGRPAAGLGDPAQEPASGADRRPSGEHRQDLPGDRSDLPAATSDASGRSARWAIWWSRCSASRMEAFARRDLRCAAAAGDGRSGRPAEPGTYLEALKLADDPRALDWGLHMNMAARALERVGDKAVDIGEQVAFLVTGEFREFTDASHSARAVSDAGGAYPPRRGRGSRWPSGPLLARARGLRGRRRRATGARALERFRTPPPDLVDLDLMLPAVSGLDVCRKIRASPTVPIVMVTAKDSEADKVAGLELGADDYVTKPFSVRELVSRVRAHLRRARDDAPLAADGELLVGGPVELDAVGTRCPSTANRSPSHRRSSSFSRRSCGAGPSPHARVPDPGGSGAAITSGTPRPWTSTSSVSARRSSATRTSPSTSSPSGGSATSSWTDRTADAAAAARRYPPPGHAEGEGQTPCRSRSFHVNWSSTTCSTPPRKNVAEGAGELLALVDDLSDRTDRAATDPSPRIDRRRHHAPDHLHAEPDVRGPDRSPRHPPPRLRAR